MFLSRYFARGFFADRYFPDTGGELILAGGLYDLRLEAQLDGVWTDITEDLELAGGLRFSRGIQGNGPMSCVASPGTMNFTLDNSARAWGLVGRYSPNHANRRDGWDFDIACRLILFNATSSRAHFTGTIRSIDPEPGEYLAQRVHVVAYDLMRDLHDTDLREIDIALNQSEDDVINDVLDLLPDEAQPAARDIDAGVDTYPYVYDLIRPETKMIAAIVDVCESSFGLFAVKGDGTPLFRSRHSRMLGMSDYEFEAIEDVVVPSTLDSVYRWVRTTVHPRTVDPAATSVLYTMEGEAPAIAPGETRTIWGDYRDQSDVRSLVGGVERQVPIAPTTDYLGNSEPDGSGTDQTAAIRVVTSDFATTAKFEITNISGSTVYLTLLQIRGKRVLDIGKQTLESREAGNVRRTRPLTIDLKLQNDPQVGQSYADFIRLQYSDQRRQTNGITFKPNYSEELMAQFLATEIGDRKAVSEPMTGLDSVETMVISVDVTIGEAMTMTCRYGLIPANTTAMWQWGIVGLSEWGETTVYAF